MNYFNSRLNAMIRGGWYPSCHGEMIDTYNKQTHRQLAVTILAGISARNHYFVCEERNINFRKYMIAKIYPDGHPDLQGKKDPTHPVRYFDIRKLTEGECLRLMDVPENDIVKLCNSKSLSRSAIYKLAGNSIVVSCLYHIFRNIWLTEDDPDEQMSLFPEPTFRMPIPDKIRLVTLCSGYDSQAIAMSQLVDAANTCGMNVSFDLLAWSEFDPEKPKVPIEKQPAVVAHNILFP